MKTLHIIDSHTGGEPTRVVVSGGPDLGAGALAERVQRFRDKHDHYRCAIVNEPRGSDVLVGALIVAPEDPACAAGVIFFNNVGYLGMCGHGTIGLVATLAYLGRIRAGTHRIETPVGIVSVTLHEEGPVSVANVASFRKARAVTVEVPGHGAVTGDIAWGGNWFFLVEQHGQEIAPANLVRLTEFTSRLRAALCANGYPEVDHIELFAPDPTNETDSRNFVLCPGGAYDRSPCGTGTSAKLACLAADDKLAEGEEWVQSSVIGSSFKGRFRWKDREKGEVEPTITGIAHLTADATVLLDPDDPLCWGIRP